MHDHRTYGHVQYNITEPRCAYSAYIKVLFVHPFSR